MSPLGVEGGGVCDVKQRDPQISKWSTTIRALRMCVCVCARNCKYLYTSGSCKASMNELLPFLTDYFRLSCVSL